MQKEFLGVDNSIQEPFRLPDLRYLEVAAIKGFALSLCDLRVW